MLDEMPMKSPWPTAFRTFAGAGLLIGIGLVFSGCQTTRPTPQIQIVERKVEVPQSLLRCRAEPKAGQWVSQKDVALFMSRLADAGEDCRRKLGSVRRLTE